MANMGFAVLFCLIFFLAEASSTKDSEEKDSDGDKPFDYNTFGGKGQGRKGWWDSFEGRIPLSLAASVSVGPFIPLGIPVPQPSFPSSAGGELDGVPVPDTSFPYEEVGHLNGMPVPNPSYQYEDGGQLDGIPDLESLFSSFPGVGPNGIIVGPGADNLEKPKDSDTLKNEKDRK